MMHPSRSRLWSLAFLGALFGTASAAPHPVDAQEIDLSAPLTPDPAVRRGTLPNGLQYFIRQNERPLERAELRLVIKAGSILEDDDQLGLAHFADQALAQLAERNGIRRGLENPVSVRLVCVGEVLIRLRQMARFRQ